MPAALTCWHGTNTSLVQNSERRSGAARVRCLIGISIDLLRTPWPNNAGILFGIKIDVFVDGRNFPVGGRFEDLVADHAYNFPFASLGESHGIVVTSIVRL